MKIKMIWGILGLCLLPTVFCLTDLQYGFSFDPAENALNGRFNAYYSPSYPLGTLANGTSLNIKITLPFPLTATLAALTLQLYKEVGSTYQLVTLITLALTNTNAEYRYDVYFPPSSTFDSANY